MTGAETHASARADRLAEIRVIAAKLNERAASLAPDLLPNGRPEGRYWRVGDFADNPGQSLAINISGSNIGLWTDFAATKGMAGYSGDMLALVAHVKFGGRLADAIKWARSVLGMDDLDPARMATETARVEKRKRAAADEAKRRAERMRRLARSMFMDPRAVPIIDTPAEAYLGGRGIDLACLEVDGQPYQPGALAFHPAILCKEVEAELPCMIARILDGSGQQIGTHRTWIAPRPDGSWRKAALEHAKKAIGDFKGGYIPLWKGACRKTLADIDAGTDIYISEGIEDGLSIACARPELRVIAAISLSNLGNFTPPPQAGRIVIIAQNDPPASKAAQALKVAIGRLQGAGATVAVVEMPAGVKDANDVLRGAVALEAA